MQDVEGKSAEGKGIEGSLNFLFNFRVNLKVLKQSL